MAKFVQFLRTEKLITEQYEVFSPRPHQDTPWWICFWILVKCIALLPGRCINTNRIYSCDVIDIDGNPVPKSKQVPTYAHAQKMRAAMTYAFGRVHGLGSAPWQEKPGLSGRSGNPSVSDVVSGYMVSLKRRKVSHGPERNESSRARLSSFRPVKLPSALGQSHRYVQF